MQEPGMARQTGARLPGRVVFSPQLNLVPFGKVAGQDNAFSGFVANAAGEWVDCNSYTGDAHGGWLKIISPGQTPLRLEVCSPINLNTLVSLVQTTGCLASTVVAAAYYGGFLSIPALHAALRQLLLTHRRNPELNILVHQLEIMSGQDELSALLTYLSGEQNLPAAA